MKLAKIKTIEDLSQYLDSAWVWRKKEISYYIQVNPNTPENPSTHYQNRAATVILYAHWEGFVKDSIRAYIQYILAQPISFKELSLPLKAIYLQLTFNLKNNFDTHSNQHWLDLALYIEDTQAQDISKPTDKLFDYYPNTKSNLNLKQFNNLLKSLELYIDELEIGEEILDQQLLAHRNAIAHGTQRNPDINFIELAEKIVIVLEKLKDLVFEYANSRKFCSIN